MYFPYLRGRQYELIALRELLENNKLGRAVIPIIEPVRLSPTLVSTLEGFKDKRQKCSIVMNPGVGSFWRNIAIFLKVILLLDWIV